MIGKSRENTFQGSDNRRIPKFHCLCFSTTGGLRTKWAPVLGTEVVESLCLEMPKSCLDMILRGGSRWPCLGKVFGPGGLQWPLQPQPFCDSVLSHCPSLLQGPGETRGHLKGSGDGQCSLGHSCFLQKGLEGGSSTS